MRLGILLLRLDKMLVRHRLINPSLAKPLITTPVFCILAVSASLLLLGEKRYGQTKYFARKGRIRLDHKALDLDSNALTSRRLYLHIKSTDLDKENANYGYNLNQGAFFHSPTSSKENVGDWNRRGDGH